MREFTNYFISFLSEDLGVHVVGYAIEKILELFV